MIVQCRAAAALREREQAPPLSVLQIFRSVVDDPVARAAPAPADIIDRSAELHRRPEPDCQQQSAKKKGRRRPAAVQPARAGRSARRSSVAQLAGIGARLARAREGSECG